MEYLKQTEELLFDPSFFRLATIWNEGFTMLDNNEYAAMSTTEAAFRVDIKKWNDLCKAVSVKRIYGGYAIPFVVYVKQNVQDTIRAEWSRFDKSTKELSGKVLERSVKALLNEVKQVKTSVPLKLYLEPLQTCIYEALNSIENHYKHQVPSIDNNELDMNEQPQRTKLKWRGGATSLCALFIDLRAEKMKKTEDRYLTMTRKNTADVGSLTDLFYETESQIKNAVLELGIADVKDDKQFAKTVKGIKERFRMLPVTISEPKIIHHKSETREHQRTYENPFPNKQEIYVITVAFPFSGSPELFEYRTGESIEISSIYLPSGNTINIDVDLRSLNKEEALLKANSEIAVTKKLIRQNNPKVEAWEKRTLEWIDELCTKQRKTLVDFYS